LFRPQVAHEHQPATAPSPSAPDAHRCAPIDDARHRHPKHSKAHRREFYIGSNDSATTLQAAKTLLQAPRHPCIESTHGDAHGSHQSARNRFLKRRLKEAIALSNYQKRLPLLVEDERRRNGCLQQIAANRFSMPQDVIAILLQGFVLHS
jgi:hypothetical protein